MARTRTPPGTPSPPSRGLDPHGPWRLWLLAGTVLIPGCAQWLTHPRHRGRILLGWYLSAVGVGVCVWGSLTGLLLLAFAYLVHVVSLGEAIRRASFPEFGVPVAWGAAAFGLGCFLYLPAWGVASWVAWPAVEPGRPPRGYLVNRAARPSETWATGALVWVGPEADSPAGPARVLAGPGEVVEREGTVYTVGGRPIQGDPGEAETVSWSLRVPADHLLVVRVERGRTDRGDGWTPRLELVARDRVLGDDLAQSLPVWERSLAASWELGLP